MTSPYIIFKGVDSRTLGVVVEKLPDLHRAPENVTLIAIDGRDGRLEEDAGTCDVYTDTMKINCFGVPLSTVYHWLSGAGWMVSSDEPDRKIWASLHPQIKNTRFRTSECYDSLTISMYCQPYRYFNPDPEAVILSSSPGEVYNPGTQRSQPVITIRANGDVSVLFGMNQMDFEGLTDGIIVDCEMMECFSLDRSELMNGYAAMDDFPVLEPGFNYVQWSGTGSVESITVERRCRDK